MMNVNNSFKALLRRVWKTIVAVEKEYVLLILCMCV